MGKIKMVLFELQSGSGRAKGAKCVQNPGFPIHFSARGGDGDLIYEDDLKYQNYLHLIQVYCRVV